MEVIEIVINNEEELHKHMEDIEEGDYFEAYFGRCHVEGIVICREDTFFRLDTERDVLRLIEFELSDVLDQLIEVAYTKHDNNNVRKVLKLVE
ncbi:MAG TPA: DUF2097 domain-containing protein [Methanothermococcus okinawensis]|uniref:DUF2097 domain-containing protein n=1 Tax=Methanothermococcus okinawensis TaxID=155863 RepID=A0A833DR22_9EURY|nr:DUF2097 domain-containing protein [Methanothermococcus okinawensis]